MVHRTGTQRTSATLPRRPHLLRRNNGTYYFRLRIPQDLLRAKAYGNKKEIKFSLGNKDRNEAARLAATQLVKWEEHFAAERKKHHLSGQGRNEDGNADKDATSLAKLCPLSSLSQIEQEDLIIRIFISLEQKSQETRTLTRANCDEFNEVLANVGTDRSIYENASPHHAPINWLADLGKELESRGVKVDTAAEEKAEALADRLQRAYVENAWRTERALEGQSFQRSDPLFKHLHADSELPANATQAACSTGKTVAELCEAYVAHKNKAKGASLAPKTLKSYDMPCLILRDYLGPETPLDAISVERAQGLVIFLSNLPINATKRYPCLSLIEASKAEGKEDQPVYVSPQRQ